jgi:alcohol dehydrogenase class IV
MSFEFTTATQIVFGPGTIQQVAPAAARMGQRAFLVTGRDPHRAGVLQDRLTRSGLGCVVFSTAGEPTVPMAEQAIHHAKQVKADVVIAFGGGSAIDLAKVVAAMLMNQGDLTGYLEVVGQGKPLVHRCAPWIAVPTTAGTGAEVTRNAVLGVPEHRRKVSIRSPLMLASLAVIDPELTYSLPPQVTASTGLDALTQLIEPFVSPAANPMTDGLCREGIVRVGRSLRRAYMDGCDAAAREDMAVASLFGGLALANARLGTVHGLAGPLGGHLNAPHGAVCGRLLPFVMEANILALHQRAADSQAVARFDELGRLLTGRSNAKAAEAIQWVYTVCCDLAVSPLSHWGLRPDDIHQMAEMARTSSSTKGNPIELTTEELIEVLERAM